MELNVVYALLSSVIISLVAIAGVLPLYFKKKISNRLLTLLLSVSVGTLLGCVFLQLLPEFLSEKYTLGLAINLMVGFLSFFILENFIHSHCNNEEHKKKLSCDSKKPLGLLNIVGDAIHNFVDGLVIGATYMVSIPLGIGASISIALHELPQEIADFGILIYAGYSKKKALLYNFLSATTAIIGTVIGLFLSSKLTNFNSFILPFIAGVFIYIAASNLIPELHKHSDIKVSILNVFSIVFGFALIALITIFGPGHIHG